jgi:adenylate kinase
VVLFGPPGAGKGTQAAVLAERLGVPAISTGDMLRRAIAEGSDLGKRVEATLAAGALVDDALMSEVLADRLARPDVADGCILDGYPRTAIQAAALDGLLARIGHAVGKVVMVEVPHDELVRRAVLRGRGADDEESVVRERLRVYEEKTAPVAEYYRERGLLVRVDGYQAIDEVARAIVAALDRTAS